MELLALREDATKLLQVTWWIIGGIFLVRYLFLPWWIYIHTRLRAQPVVELIDWQHYPLPIAFRERIERVGRDLQALGFLPQLAYLVNFNYGYGDVASFRFVHPETQDNAEISGILAATNAGTNLRGMFFSFGSRFALREQPILRTSNLDSILNFGYRPNDSIHAFPHITQVSKLLELHKLLQNRHFPNTPRYIDPNGESPDNFVRYAHEIYRKMVESWVMTRRVERVANETDCRYRVIAIYQLCWGSWLPFKPFVKWFRYQKSRRREQELRRHTG
ncbi:MAG: hypothetical protein V4719_17830 [Planctomycetota bacterium]